MKANDNLEILQCKSDCNRRKLLVLTVLILYQISTTLDYGEALYLETVPSSYIPNDIQTATYIIQNKFCKFGK